MIPFLALMLFHIMKRGGEGDTNSSVYCFRWSSDLSVTFLISKIEYISFIFWSNLKEVDIVDKPSTFTLASNGNN